MKYYNWASIFKKAPSLVFATVLLVVGCKMTKQIQFAKDTAFPIELGSIVQREGTLKNNIEIKGMPMLSNRLRVSIVKKEFSASIFDSYSSIVDINKSNIAYADSLSSKPMYYEVELIDDIVYASMINDDRTIREYIKNSKNASTITKIMMVGDKSIQSNEVTAAFIENSGNNTYSIVLYKGDEQLNTIPFSDMTIFDYEVSSFCFGKDARNQIAIMDLVEEGKGCKRPLVRKAKKLSTFKKLSDY